MKLSKTSEYAIRVLIYLAARPEEKFSVSTLHQELHLPYKYLGRLMGSLAEAEIVTSIQGKQGGFRLAGAPSDIYLRQIVSVTEGLDSFQGCVLGFENCSDENPCALHGQWSEIQSRIEKMINNYSLAELASKPVMKH